MKPLTQWLWTIFPPKHPSENHVAWGGQLRGGSFYEFVAEVKRQHAGPVYQKGTGPYVTAATLSDGHRCNASAQALNILFLDCDEGKPWDKFKDFLDFNGYSYCLYETASSTPEKPKWRCALPLKYPVDLSSPERQADWRRDYVTVMSHLEKHTGVEFDPALKAPSQAIYFGNRRTSDTPPRLVKYYIYGKPYDLHLVLRALTPKQDTKKARPLALVSCPNASHGVKEAVAQGWLNAHPCPEPGKRHFWVVKAAHALIRGCNLPPAVVIPWLSGMSGGDDRDVSGIVAWTVGLPPDSKGYLLPGARYTYTAKELQPFTALELGAYFEIKNTELRAAELEAKRQKAYWAPLEARVAKRGSASPQSVQNAREVIAEGKKHSHILRRKFATQGQRKDTEKCGFAQTLGNVRTHQMAIHKRRCGKKNCPVCGPRNLSIATIAMAAMSPTDGGPPLQNRTVYRFCVPDSKWESWQRRLARFNSTHHYDIAEESRINVRTSSILGMKGAIDDVRTFSTHRGEEKTLFSNTFAAYKPSRNANWVVFCSAPLAPEGARVKKITDPKAVRTAMLATMERTYNYTPDAVLPTGIVTGTTRCSKTITRDVDKIVTTSVGNEWVVEQDRAISLEDAAKAMFDMGVNTESYSEGGELVNVTSLLPVDVLSHRLAVLDLCSGQPAPPPVIAVDETSLDGLLDEEGEWLF